MQIENIYPKHTTEAEWTELAFLASKLLTAFSVSLQEAEGEET